MAVDDAARVWPRPQADCGARQAWGAPVKSLSLPDRFSAKTAHYTVNSEITKMNERENL